MRSLGTLFFAFLAPVALALPEGFVIRPFAGPPQVEYPTAATASANGDLYISSDKNASLGHAKGFGKIVRATDTNGDGKADQFQDFVPDVNSPRGGHFVNGTLYLIHPPYLSSFRDTNGDGVADEHKVLVKGFGGGIEHPRGADHTTNAVRMGIDGWLYVSVGDFGMADAVGADGKHMTLHGGGIVRVRPDGSEVEPYALMIRNVYDTAISPYLDLFSRDNTNDGKGWNTRLHQFTALGDHGYPRLYQNFADETVQPLADYGGGSGTGGLYLHEPGFPKDYGDSLYTCDWTTENVYRHPLTPQGSSFAIKQEVFQAVPRTIDLDVDGFSRLYLVDWRNGSYGYTPGAKVGMIQQIVCPGETAARYTDVTKAAADALPGLLASRSAVQRLEAQQEILRRGAKFVPVNRVLALAQNTNQPLYARVAAIFTYKQLLGSKATPALAKLSADPAVREFALRAMTDRLGELKGVPVQPYLAGLKDPNARVRLQALIGFARLKESRATPHILAAAAQWSGDDSRLRHTAVKTLVQLGNAKACLTAASKGDRLAFRALQEMHSAEVVAGLTALADTTSSPEVRNASLGALARLFHREKPWDLVSWWQVRPDDRGPYFEPVTWEETPRIQAAIERNYTKLSKPDRDAYVNVLTRNRVPVTKLRLDGLDPLLAAFDAPSLDGALLEVVVDAAKDGNRSWEQRLQCYRALEKTPAEHATPAKLAILAEWSGRADVPPAAGQFAADFINDPKRGHEISRLRELAAKQGDAVSRIAWKALLTVLNSPLSKPEAKGEVRKALDANPREIGFFQALQDMKLSGFDAQIEAGLHSDNQQLISAAKAAREAAAQSSGAGKKVGELPAAEVAKLALTAKGDVATGQRLFLAQGCIACHSIDPNAAQKGPYLGAAGAKFSRDYLIESVLDPAKVVAQGFRGVSFRLKSGSTHTGFVTGEADGLIELRDIAGQVQKIRRDEVAEEQHLPGSMMPPGLASGLTVVEFNALIEYLVSLKAVGG
jgi:putative heme-binding domain-containing protein